MVQFGIDTADFHPQTASQKTTIHCLLGSDQAVGDLIPKDVHGVRQFLGIAFYYRRLIPPLCETRRTLHQLTGKDVLFQWTPKHCQEVFDALKTKLSVGLPSF